MHPLFIWVLSTLLISVIAAKLSSYLSDPTPPKLLQFMFLSLVLSTATWKERETFNRGMTISIGVRASLTAMITLPLWQTYLDCVPSLEVNWIVQSYLSLIPLYALGQLLRAVLELAFGLTGWHYPAHFQFPPLAKTLTEFWGRRWASWVADWLNQMIFRGYRNSPMRSSFVHRLYLWIIVVIPAPLVVNEGMFRVAGLFISN